MALGPRWRSPLIVSSLLALTVSTLLQGINIARQNEPWMFYVAVTVSVALLLIYTYVGLVRIEENESQWLEGLRLRRFEKSLRILVLVAIQTLLGVTILFFKSGKEAISCFILIIAFMFLIWDFMIRFLGRGSQSIKKTFYRFVIGDILVLFASIVILWTSTLDLSRLNQIILGTMLGPALIFISIIFTAGFQEKVADWCTQKRWLP